MNRLQKKCLIATTGFHLFLIAILFVGPGFFAEKPRPDDTQLLKVIPSTTVDDALNLGVKNPPPPPAPQIIKPPEPQPQPTTPPPTPEPPKPMVKPEPVKPVEPVKPPDKLTPEELAPAVKPTPKPPQHKYQVDMNPVVRPKPKVNPAQNSDDSQAQESRKEQQRRLKAIADAATVIQKNASSSTKIEMQGDSSESKADYASVVKSIYEQAWIPPEDTASDDANTKVSVTLARDGTVISSRIIEASADARVDASVRRTLDQVTFVRPFPDGSTDKERTFIINFNLKAKRMLG